MANKRISSLDDITLVGGTSTAEVNANDILPITDVDDTTGSVDGTTKAVKVSDLMGEAPVQSVAGRTGAVTITNTDVSGLGTAATSASTDFSSAFKSLTTPAFTGTPLAYTLTASDNGKVVIVDESSNAYITVPQSLGSGFNCTVVQKGTGRVTLQAGTGVSVAGYNLGVATIGQYGVIDLVPISTDNYYVTGDTSTAPFLNTYSASFDGIDDHLYFGTSATNQNVTLGTTDFALSMWFYPESTTQDYLFNDTTLNDRAFINNGTFTLKGYGTQVDITSAYSINNWYHLVIERTSGTEKIYIDAVLKNSRSESGTFNIGQFGYVSGAAVFQGKMDEISFHSQGLSLSDVSAIYNGGGPIDLSGSYNTTHWWRMGDSASGSTILDQVGSENLTASGASLTDTNVPS